MSDLHEGLLSFAEDFEEVSWTGASVSKRKAYVMELLDMLETSDGAARRRASIILHYLVLGEYVEETR